MTDGLAEGHYGLAQTRNGGLDVTDDGVTARGDEAGGPPIRWEAPIPLVTSRFFMGDSLMAIGISVALMYVAVFLMALVVNGEVLIVPWPIGAGVFAVFAVLFPLIALVVFQNRIDASFAVSAEGFEVAGGARMRKVNRVVLVFALLSGRPSAIGPAMLASADEGRAIPWRDVRKVKYHARNHVIELRDSIFRMSRLFCPPDRYAEIEARVRAEVAHTPHLARKFDRGDAARRLAWNVATAAGWFLAVAWDPDHTLAWLSAAAVALVVAGWIDWWLGRLMALAGMACTIVAAARIAQRALQATEYDGLFTIHGYDTDGGLLGISCAGLLLLATVGIRHGILTARR
jgi:hypothetical protein